MNFLKYILIFSGFFFLTLLSCQSHNTPVNEDENKKNKPVEVKNQKSQSKGLKFTSPSKDDTFIIGDQVEVTFKKTNKNLEIDSVQLNIDNKPATFQKKNALEYLLETNSLNPGKRKLSAQVYFANGSKSRISINLLLKSDIIPENLQYEIIKIFPHDPKAYTQGLVIEGGFLYEGTGERGKSSLRKIELETGELLSSLNLPPDLFGEGICIFEDKIIQLTWTSGIGFVYDKKSFKFQNRIRYNTQGWGLTTDGESLIMSDGSQYIYFLEPSYFSETSRIEVFDDKGPVKSLNELEYINDVIYANIYMTDKIAIIEPETGKVLSYINLEGLLKEEDKHPGLDVLNGIAYDKQNDRLFVTGKNWPKLFEIKTIDN